MSFKNKLSEEIQKQFPTIRKSEDYANIILQAHKLKAFNKKSSVRKKTLGNIKQNAFTRCHKIINLLVKVDNGSSSVSPISDRDNVVFKFDYAQQVLDIEHELLLIHIGDNPRVKKICVDILKIPSNSTIQAIKQKIKEGSIFKQGSVYEKMFKAIKENKIQPKEYLKFNIRPIPVPTYYLSKIAKNITQQCIGGE